MQLKQLSPSFYNRDTHVVAKELLGKLLVRNSENETFIARINEVESYIGVNDKACHASKGRTKRTEVMFGEAGHAYVYLIYGMYHCLNVVTEKEGFPAAVLIRGAVPVQGFATKKPTPLNGPGKLCREMRIDKTCNAKNLTTSRFLYIADDGFAVTPQDITTTPRINVDYAGEDALLPWRYVINLPTQNA